MSVVNSSEHSDNTTPRGQSVPQSPARLRGYPAYGRIALDPSTRTIPGAGGSSVLLGGSPLRLMKLTGKSETVVRLLSAGATVSEAAIKTNASVRSVAALADRLLDGQLAHPLWPPLKDPTQTSAQMPKQTQPSAQHFAQRLARAQANVQPDVEPPTPSGAGINARSDGNPHPELPDTPNLSTVTLVVPVKDREVQLRRLLVSVQREVAEGLKVVVVDDGSTDNSADVARELGATVIRHEVSRGPASARNRGLAAIDTAFIAFVDSDCVCTYGWLPILLQHFQDPAIALVAPRIFGAIAPQEQQQQQQQPGTADSLALASYEAVRSPLDLGPAQALVVPRTRVSYVPSAALVARTEVLRALDGFATDLHVGEDVDLLWRLHRAGWRSRYEPAATVAHDHRVSWRAFARRRMQYGTSAALLDERHPGQVAPLAVSGWSALGWLGLCTLTPVGVIGGLGVMTATTALLPNKLGVVEDPNKLAFNLASRGHFGAGRQLGDATWRAYLPLAIAASFTPFLAPTARRILLASAVIPNVLDWRSKHPKLDPLRYVGIRLFDDASYCAGVWLGAFKQRSFRALKPDFTSWPGRSPKPSIASE
jgi:mycofactocin glycosyltransferase